MATAHKYTSMPWAIRSSSSLSTAGSASPNSDPTTMQASNTAALIQQLADSHAANRELERRIADLHMDHAKHIQEVTRNLEQRAGDLLREVQQAQAREIAVRGVFIWNYEKEQELRLKIREIEAREAEVKEAEVKEAEEILDFEKRSLEQSKANFEERKCTPSETRTSLQKEVMIPQEDKRKNISNYPFHTLATKHMFESKNASKFDEYKLVISFDIMNDDQIQLLRRHDYYKGWMDSTKVAGQEESVRQGIFNEKNFPHLADEDHPKNPVGAGFSAGALFTWAALCKDHEPQWSVRLDDWYFTTKNLKIPQLQEDRPFWVGFADGAQYARKQFQKYMATSNEYSEEG